MVVFNDGTWEVIAWLLKRVSIEELIASVMLEEE
jgi:hypothetical protein